MIKKFEQFVNYNPISEAGYRDFGPNATGKRFQDLTDKKPPTSKESYSYIVGDKVKLKNKYMGYTATILEIHPDSVKVLIDMDGNRAGRSISHTDIDN